MAMSSQKMTIKEREQLLFHSSQCKYRMYIAESEIPDAGLGLFVKEDVPAGKEIFRAPAVVSAVNRVKVNGSDFDLISAKACDNCHAWPNLEHLDRAPIRLLNCASCHRVQYCSKVDSLPFCSVCW